MAIQRQLDVLTNGGSVPAVVNATTNYPANTSTIVPPQYDITNDSTFNIGLTIVTEYIQQNIKNISSKISPESFFASTKTLILNTLELYRDDLQDESSRIYELFHFLTTEMTDAKYILFFLFFRGLNQNIYSINDLFVYLDNKGLELIFENIVSFFNDIKQEKAQIIKSRLEEYSHEVYGNLFSFINDKYNNTLDQTFFHEELGTTDFIKEDQDYLLSPEIDYTSLAAYRNLREAEEDYWVRTGAYNFTGTYTLARTKEIRSLIINKNYNQKVHGIPVLMKKNSQKFLYFEDGELNKLIVSILKKSYAKLTYSEAEKFIDKMCLELVDYYLYEVPLTFNYSEESTQLPDIFGFTRYKIDDINQRSLTKITLDEIKEIKFYLNVVAAYLGTKSSETTLQTKNDTIDSEFSSLRNGILGLRQYLIDNGNFKEV